MDDPLEPLTMALWNSMLVRAVQSVRRDGGFSFALGSSPVRPLTEDEIDQLRANGNTADDWTLIRVADGFQPGAVCHSDFHGTVVFGRFDGTVRGPGGVKLPAGVSRSRIADSVIGHDAAVRNVGLLTHFVVGPHAAVIDCGQVVCDGPTHFGNGVPLRIGLETGERLLAAFAEITLNLAEMLTSGPCAERDRYAALLAAYLDAIQSDRGIIASEAIVAYMPAMRNCFIGSAAELDGAGRVENCTLLSSPRESTHLADGACVTDSILQWGAHIAGPAVLARTVLLEHACVEPFGKVTDAILGPNTVVGGAEVTASLVGPFVGCHHQSLLIAARWPHGRGNIGYGAGFGCNHTSRAPDQEAILGEGVFVGLGARVQYPINLSGSPYSLLASGVMLPPQRVAFPFSLICQQSAPIPGYSPAANILIPAWVLSDNLYAIERSMQKFRSRDHSLRHHFSYEVFRPEIRAIMADACHRLEEVRGVKETYTDRDIPGLGRNVLCEPHRVAAIACYREHLDRCTLLDELKQLETDSADPTSNGNAAVVSDEQKERLLWLSELLERYGNAVERSKERDDLRGPAIIPDYDDVHLPARSDEIVQSTWNTIHLMQSRISRLVGSLVA